MKTTMMEKMDANEEALFSRLKAMFAVAFVAAVALLVFMIGVGTWFLMWLFS